MYQKQRTCRTCMTMNCMLFVDIFEHYEGNTLLSKLLMEFTALKVEKQDELSKYMCNRCVEKLISAQEFRVMAIQSALNFQDDQSSDSLPPFEKQIEANIGETQGIEVIHIKEEIPVTYEETQVLNVDVKQEDEVRNSNLFPQISENSEENYESEAISIRLNTNMEIPSLKSVYVFNGKGVPLTKDGRKLTSNEKKRVPVLCKICNRSYKYEYYRVHEKLHVSDRPFKCDKCDEAFDLSGALEAHQLIHSNKTPSNLMLQQTNCIDACDIGEKGYKMKRVMKQPLRWYDKDKRYVCKVCGKSFSDSGTLWTHKSVHAHKTYLCPNYSIIFPRCRSGHQQ